MGLVGGVFKMSCQGTWKHLQVSAEANVSSLTGLETVQLAQNWFDVPWTLDVAKPCFADGYLRWAVHTDRCVGLQHTPETAVVDLRICGNSGDKRSQWTLPQGDEGLVRWAEDASRCLAAKGEWNGSPVRLEACTEASRKQRWRVARHGSYGELRFADTDFCLDVEGGGAEEGTPLQLWQCYTISDNQMWSFGGEMRLERFSLGALPVKYGVINLGMDASPDIAAGIQQALRQEFCKRDWLRSLACNADSTEIEFGQEVSEVVGSRLQTYLGELFSKPVVQWNGGFISMELFLARLAEATSNGDGVSCASER